MCGVNSDTKCWQLASPTWEQSHLSHCNHMQPSELLAKDLAMYFVLFYLPLLSSLQRIWFQEIFPLTVICSHDTGSATPPPPNITQLPVPNIFIHFLLPWDEAMWLGCSGKGTLKPLMSLIDLFWLKLFCLAVGSCVVEYHGTVTWECDR